MIWYLIGLYVVGHFFWLLGRQMLKVGQWLSDTTREQ